MRCLVLAAVVLAGVRGGLFALADEISLADSGLGVNAVVPAIVAALVVGILVRLRPRLTEFSRPLLIGWCLIAAVVLMNMFFQGVGLKLYGIGVAQYLVYPTLALVIWPLMEEGDERRLARVLIAIGIFVALTVMLQASGIENFIQAANAEVDGLNSDRYAGITGSYLHTSAFLGAAFVLTMGESMAASTWRNRAIGLVLLATLLSAIILTFSRSGVMISAIGAVILIASAGASGAHRLRLLALVVPAIVVALGIGALGGVTPDEAKDRVLSGLRAESDAGNQLRTSAIENGIELYGDLSTEDQALGIGLAATGNARQLDDADQGRLIVESYFLKVLLETGLLGFILIGGFLIWSFAYYAWVSWKFSDPRLVSLAAAGIGLGLYNVIYPVLETQLLGMAWWLLLSISLWASVQRSSNQTRLLWPIGNGGRKD